MKKFLKVLFVISITWVFFSACGEKQVDIHERVLTIDTHVDTPVSRNNGFHITKLNDRTRGGGQVDFPRMKKGGLDAICYAIFLSQGKRTDEDFEKCKIKGDQDFNDILKVIKDNPDQVELALTPEDAYRIEKAGKRIVFLSIENGYSMGLDLGLIKKYYDYGLRLSGLCHGRNNEICDSCTDEPEHNGLSEKGKKVVAEMNRLGIVIDVSHISDAAFFDVVKESKAPIVASHSCARALCDQSRNMTDQMLLALKKNGGVIQLCLLSDFIKKDIPQSPERVAAMEKLEKAYRDSEQTDEDSKTYYQGRRDVNQKYPQVMATVADAMDHVDYLVKLIGIDHVGLASDFDGGGGLADLRDASDMGNVTKELQKRGYTDEQIEKIWGGNFMRVMKEVQKVK